MRRGNSIRRSLRLALMATAGFCLFFACLAFWIYDVVTIRNAMVEQATAIAQVVGLNSAVALAFDDPSAADETLGALSAVAPVTAAVIYDANGRVFAVYERGSESGASFEPPPARAPGQTFSGAHLDLFDRIASTGQPIGMVFLRWDTKALAVRAQWYAIIVLGLLAGSFALAALISSRLQRRVSVPLAELVKASGAIAAGDLTTQVKVSSGDEIGSLARSFNEMSAGLRDVVSEVRQSTAEVSGASALLGAAAAGISQEAERQDHAIGDAVGSIDRLVESIREINSSVEGLTETGQETSASAVEMNGSISEIASNMGHLGDSIDATSASVQQVASNTDQVAKAVENLQEATTGALDYLGQLENSVRAVKTNAEMSDALSEDSSQEAARGLTAMNETNEAMREIAASFGQLEVSVSRLSEKSQAIEAIIEVIDGVAEQTSQLSLNASIIAAQAGEHGKSFGVVATAVSAVSERTRRSTREVVELIRAVQAEIGSAVEAVKSGSKKVEHGVQRSDLSESVLRKILEKSQKTSERVREIAEAAQLQSGDLQRLNTAIDGVKGIVEEIHGAMRDQQVAAAEIARAIETIRSLGKNVRRSTHEQRKGSHAISEAMVNVTSMIDEIASAMKQQAHSSATLQGVIEIFRQAVVESISRSEAMGQVVATLSQRSQKLESGIGRFRFDE